MITKPVRIIGGGLAGCEAAWGLSKFGIPVELYEMKPKRFSAVHVSKDLAELVCSNSLGSQREYHASALLKEEMKILGSLVMEAAEHSRVPSGRALAVDRRLFSEFVTGKLESCPTVKIIREEIKDLDNDGITVVASGPLTSETLSLSIKELIGQEFLYFYDAVSPIVEYSSIDLDKAFFGSRYEDSDDYLNIPLTRDEYENLVKDLKTADVIGLHDADKGMFFEGCLPVEELAKRGDETLAFGPLKPVGLKARGSVRDMHAVIQLRRENRQGSMYNLVGFQTRMTETAQKRVLRNIPALEHAEFLRYGRMHRNTYINSRKLLASDLSLSNRRSIYFCGQVTGVEGYLESSMSGMAVSLYIGAKSKGIDCGSIPKTCMSGSLLDNVVNKDYDWTNFSPMNANYGILKQHYETKKLNKSMVKEHIFNKSLEVIKEWFSTHFEGLLLT